MQRSVWSSWGQRVAAARGSFAASREIPRPQSGAFFHNFSPGRLMRQQSDGIDNLGKSAWIDTARPAYLFKQQSTTFSSIAIHHHLWCGLSIREDWKTLPRKNLLYFPTPPSLFNITHHSTGGQQEMRRWQAIPACRQYNLTAACNCTHCIVGRTERKGCVGGLVVQVRQCGDAQ